MQWSLWLDSGAHMCAVEMGMGVMECELSGMHLSRDLETGASKCLPSMCEAPGSKET